MTQQTYSDLSEPQKAVLDAIPYDKWVGPGDIDRTLSHTGQSSNGRTASICHTLNKRGFVKRAEKKWGRGKTSQYLRVKMTCEAREAKTASDEKKAKADPFYELKQLIDNMEADVESCVDGALRFATTVEDLMAYPRLLRSGFEALATDPEEVRRLTERVKELEGKLNAVKKQLGV